MARILVVDDTAVDRKLAGGLLAASSALEVEYAENGKLALERLAEEPPDLVVTDMQMPEMGGLELVSQIRTHYPHIPLVLMTAKGSEAVAVEALERGAASYVPKSQLADRLQTTVHDLISLVRADRSYTDLIDCQQRLEFDYELQNDPALIDALVDLVQQMIGGMELTDETGQLRVGIALREALAQCLISRQPRNLEARRRSVSGIAHRRGSPDLVASRAQQAPYCDRRIRVQIHMDRQQASFRIEDGGAGFDYASQLTQIDPDEPLDGEKGRGFVLMLSLMDEVSFNESGNCVTLAKYRDAES